MNDEPTNLGGPAIGATNATSLPAVVDRATLQPLQTKLEQPAGFGKGAHPRRRRERHSPAPLTHPATGQPKAA
jgi:hypothetical protein